MSKIAFQSQETGTGTFTIAAPVGDTNRTLTIPDASGTLITTAGGAMSGAFSNFSSTGIADNATSTALTIDSAGRVLMPYQPFISAATNTFDGTGYAINYSNTTVTITSTIYQHYNVGNNFNYSTGIFTAPITGDYLVIARFSNDTSTVERNIGHLWINGVFQGEFCESYGPYDNSVNSAIFRLVQNDTIRIGINTSLPYTTCNFIVRMLS